MESRTLFISAEVLDLLQASLYACELRPNLHLMLFRGAEVKGPDDIVQALPSSWSTFPPKPSKPPLQRLHGRVVVRQST